MSRIVIALIAACVLAVSACMGEGPFGFVPGGPTTSPGGTIVVATVMTRNIYLGADFSPVFQARADAVADSVAVVWAQVQRTNFPRRAGLLAAEIARSNPDVVGLQEVALYEEGDLRLDYLATLMDSLASRGAAYHVVIQNENSDVKLPMRTGTIVSDLRVVDRDVIIARDGVTTVNAKSGIYAAVATRGLGNQPLKQARGWSSVDVELEHTGFRFINTHLEAESQPSVQDAQTTELIELTRHAPGNVIIAGDLNSAADGAHRTYARLRNALLVDVWDWRVPGYTCCNLPDLSNDVPAHVRRVDLVMVFGFFSRTIRAELVGATSGDYRDGLWPSSHAGVVMTIREQ